VRRTASLAREYFMLASSSIAISLAFAHLFLISGMPSVTRSSVLGGLGEVGMAVALALLGLAGTTVFYTLLIKKREFEARLILGAVFGPTVGILVLIVGQAILLSVVKQTNALAVALIIIISLYVSVFSVVFVITGSLSRMTRNIMYVVYGSVIGGFIGIGLSSITFIVVLTMIGGYDLFVANSGLLRNIVGDLSKGSGMEKLAYKSGQFETGVGDFIFSSSLPAHAYVHFGIDVLLWTLLLVLAGYLINFTLAVRKGYAGGIAAPTFLGIIPILVRLMSNVR